MAQRSARTTKSASSASGRAPKRYISPKIPIAQLDTTFARADVVIDGLDHSGPSFEARVFVNNERATADTPRTLDKGYAGSFHIFGHGGCYGDDITHCEI